MQRFQMPCTRNKKVERRKTLGWPATVPVPAGIRKKNETTKMTVYPAATDSYQQATHAPSD